MPPLVDMLSELEGAACLAIPLAVERSVFVAEFDMAK